MRKHRILENIIYRHTTIRRYSSLTVALEGDHEEQFQNMHTRNISKYVGNFNVVFFNDSHKAKIETVFLAIVVGWKAIPANQASYSLRSIGADDSQDKEIPDELLPRGKLYE